MNDLRALHLFANYKWTGPADPAIRTAARLREQGLDTAFAQAGWMHRGGEHRMAEELLRWRLPVVTGLELRKHFHLASLWRDVRALRRVLVRDGYRVLHCHQAADHLTAALALRGMTAPPVLVRTLYEPDPAALTRRERWCLQHSDGVIAPTRTMAAALTTDRGPAVLVQEPVTERREAGPDLRAAWGLDRGHLVVGITARIQPHRRFHLLWETAAAVIARVPQARFVLLGRGNERDTEALVRARIRALGIEREVVLPGYLREPEYSAALRSLDVFLFLVPGSDGTCRAVREAMAMGLPVVATARGILPELVRAGSNGMSPGAIADETPVSLAASLVGLLTDRERRLAAGRAAQARARTDMDPVAAARALAAFYQGLLSRRGDGDEQRTLARWWQQFRESGRLPPGSEPVRGRIVREVGRASLPSGPVFLKAMAFPRAKDKLRYLLRPLPAVHEARMLHQLARTGIPAPSVRRVFASRRCLLPHRSLLVLQSLPVASGAPPTLSERAALASHLCLAGVFHPDLNESNFVRLQDGRVAVLDLQSARPRRLHSLQEARLTAAARLWSETPGRAEDAAALLGSGLVHEGELAAVQERALRLRQRWLRSRIARCLQESTEFQRRKHVSGVEHRRRGAWTEGSWLRGGRELVEAWIGERALEVLRGRTPCLLALFRTWSWLPARHSVYIPAPSTESSFRAELPALREGFAIYLGLLRTSAAASSPGLPPVHGGGVDAAG